MMPWSGLSQTSVKHAYEMGTSELHRTSIMLAAIALTTNRSKYPKDLSQRLCEKAGRTRRPKSTALADHSVCAKSLDRSGPVTEVLTLSIKFLFPLSSVAFCLSDYSCFSSLSTPNHDKMPYHLHQARQFYLHTSWTVSVRLHRTLH